MPLATSEIRAPALSLKQSRILLLDRLVFTALLRKSGGARSRFRIKSRMANVWHRRFFVFLHEPIWLSALAPKSGAPMSRRFHLTDLPHRSGAHDQWLAANAPQLDRPLERLSDAPVHQRAQWEWLVAQGLFGTPHPSGEAGE